MANSNEVYLGKTGKTFGPYSKEEFELMFSNGTLSNYSWIWDWKALSWKPLEPPPPSVMSSKGNDDKNSEVNWSLVEAVCFDLNHLISGKLDSITESGCLFISEQRMNGTQFAIRSQVSLNLFDPKSKRSLRLLASINNLSFENHTWVYQIRWKQVPSFDLKDLKAAR